MRGTAYRELTVCQRPQGLVQWWPPLSGVLFSQERVFTSFPSAANGGQLWLSPVAGRPTPRRPLSPGLGQADWPVPEFRKERRSGGCQDPELQPVGCVLGQRWPLCCQAGVSPTCQGP